MNQRSVIFFLSLIAMMLSVQCLTNSSADAVELRDVLSRSLVFQRSFFSPFFIDNSWQRQDRFNNASTNAIATITGIDLIVFDPSVIGFDDIFGPLEGPTNVLDVVAEAARRNPGFDSWGASWDETRNPATAPWHVFGEFYAAASPGNFGTLRPFPVVLAPGTSADLWSTISTGPFNRPAGDTVSEVVVGFKYSGFVTLVPEPSSGVLLMLASITGFKAVRRVPGATLRR